jgi:hypothetical protein
MKPIPCAIIAIMASHAAFATEAETWQLAKATIGRIEDGSLPSAVCGAARQEYFLLLVEDSESVVIFQHPDGGCVVGFPVEDKTNASTKTKRMVMTQPLNPMAGNEPIVWIQGVLDKAGTTTEFFKLIMVRNKGGVKDTVFLRRKGAGALVQWELS